MRPSTAAANLVLPVWQLNADYARAIDEDWLEDWPEFFAAECPYTITSADNHRRDQLVPRQNPVRRASG
jgi:anthranilate 1,2-dioxygenase small subunit